MSLALELVAAPSFHVFTVFAPFVCCALFLAVLVRTACLRRLS
ncbi:hypothetical protein QQM39_06370 [Streptomyces sp. DT2A-34]|nr:hypothetical protein [Streptomyces sp. DT2A-34]MDO0910494.1 hypothetical protein [Streptomyces sp. DT2A-34]